ncbi:MAG: hypothetical protein A3H91_02680 [Gammaproteobacteria bacterium RIFCSPLOWO2_02_FULL_61_13]|nr:MAG: hypothetical protein A3H91_02680 [Gammaproteobacteria bacterium RIFCSPLOWO2_02_FULL_61_13]
MRTRHLSVFVAMNAALAVATTAAAELETFLPLKDGGGETYGGETYYVEARFGTAAPADFLVDTGSGYLVINAATFAALREAGQAEYLRDVSGSMADGSKTKVSIYRVTSFQIGCCCVAKDVEAAVFPKTRRQILGLSALKKLAPFAVSFDPPQLALSQCAGQAAEAFDPATGNSPAIAAMQ